MNAGKTNKMQPHIVVGVDGSESSKETLNETLDVVFRKNRPEGLIGNIGRGGFTGLLFGSVSSTCTEHATSPVLVVHGGQ